MSEASHVEGLIPMLGKHTVGILLFINKLSQKVEIFTKKILPILLLFAINILTLSSYTKSCASLTV